jgi:hypothetical protein
LLEIIKEKAVWKVNDFLDSLFLRRNAAIPPDLFATIFEIRFFSSVGTIEFLFENHRIVAACFRY